MTKAPKKPAGHIVSKIKGIPVGPVAQKPGSRLKEKPASGKGRMR